MDDSQRSDLIRLVQHIMAAQGTEEEIAQWVNDFKNRVPHPHAANLIYYPHRSGLGNDPSAEEIVDAALAYKPIQL